MSGGQKRRLAGEADWHNGGMSGSEWFRLNNRQISMVKAEQEAERLRLLEEQHVRYARNTERRARASALASRNCGCGEEGCTRCLAAEALPLVEVSDEGKHASQIIVLTQY